MSFLELASKTLERQRPAQKEVEIGTFGEYLRKTTLHSMELVVLLIMMLLFSGVALGVVATATDHWLRIGLCTGVSRLS